MKKEKSWIIRGIGIGMICSAILFWTLSQAGIIISEKTMSDEEIKEKAQNLGMISVKDVDNVYLTDDEVIEKAKELGMDFTDQQ